VKGNFMPQKTTIYSIAEIRSLLAKKHGVPLMHVEIYAGLPISGIGPDGNTLEITEDSFFIQVFE
jgi:hypothetical protein